MKLPPNDKSPENVRGLLNEAGLSWSQASLALMVSRRSIAHYCAGTSPIPYPTLLALHYLVLTNRR